MTPGELAKKFHEIYERLAPRYGYKTRDESAVDWKDVPEKNKKLMIATCKAILQETHLIDLGDYVLQEPEKSYCPHCEKNVHLLAPRGRYLPSRSFPFFFLCSYCGAVLKAGMDEVAPPEKR